MKSFIAILLVALGISGCKGANTITGPDCPGGCGIPTPTWTMVPPTFTPTVRPTDAPPTPSPTKTATSTPTLTPTPTATTRPTDAPTAAPTPVPTLTSTPVPTCTYLVEGKLQNFTYQGGNGGFSVSTFPSSCSWTAVVSSQNAGWIEIKSGFSGTGNGSGTYVVGGNGGLARTGTIIVAGQALTIAQGAHP